MKSTGQGRANREEHRVGLDAPKRAFWRCVDVALALSGQRFPSTPVRALRRQALCLENTRTHWYR